MIISGVNISKSNNTVAEWQKSVISLLSCWDPAYEPEKRACVIKALKEFDGLSHDDKISYAPAVSALVADAVDWKIVLGKSLQSEAMLAIAKEDFLNKAVDILTRNKNVPPNHKYSHREGGDDSPKFYYNDESGNVYRYSNAPNGHPDNVNMYGDPEINASEPLFDANPEYYKPDGKKLSRCPDCEEDQVEWNPQYNRHDTQNMWAGRWMDAESGAYRYTYLDADIRSFPRFRIHQQNAIVDVQLPALRTAINGLYSSDRLKDQLTALALSLLDQGRMRASEVASLTPSDIFIDGGLLTIRNRRIHADSKILGAIESLKQHKSADEPLFAVPLQDVEGKVDQTLQRRLGPNYFASVLEQYGVSLLGLQTYHATLRFYQEMKRLIERYKAPWDQAMNQALMCAAMEWGHDFGVETDTMGVMQLIQSVLIDPIIVDALKQSAQEAGLLVEFASMPLPTPAVPVPYVSIDLMTKTSDEEEFSQWLHAAPIHEYPGNE